MTFHLKTDWHQGTNWYDQAGKPFDNATHEPMACEKVEQQFGLTQGQVLLNCWASMVARLATLGN